MPRNAIVDECIRAAQARRELQRTYRARCAAGEPVGGWEPLEGRGGWLDAQAVPVPLEVVRARAAEAERRYLAMREGGV